MNAWRFILSSLRHYRRIHLAVALGVAVEDGGPLPEPLGGKKFSGRFVLRVEPALHQRLAAKALAAGESLNSYCVKTLAKT